MPTENERKFVLNVDSEDAILYSDIDLTGYRIEQAYLPAEKGAIRIRSSEQMGKLSDTTERFFTFKCKVPDRLVEIETPIDERDFNSLWEELERYLFKYRYVTYHNSQKWEIDFFVHDDIVYFAMAECELPEGQTEPAEIPDFIKDNLLYEVPIDNKGFSSKDLCDQKYAGDLLKRLEDGRIRSKK